MRRFVLLLTLLASCLSVRGHDVEIFSDGRRVAAEEFRDISYLCLEGTGKKQIEIRCAEDIRNCEISPTRREVRATVNGRTAKFTLPGEGHWVVTVNGEPRVFIFADPKEKTPRKNILNVRDFACVQDALDAASGSGKTLVFPDGKYLCGTLRIGSDTDIYLSKGALLQASPNREDFPSDSGRLEADKINRPESYSDNGEFMTFSRFILIEGDNIAIRGRGTIDGNGTALRSQGKPSNLIRVRNSKNVLIEGVILRNPAAWNTHILASEDVTVRNVKIINDPQVANTDGIDPDSSCRVLVDKCFAYCSDDNIAVKSTNNSSLLRNVDDILVRDCVFLTKKSALKVGTETKADKMSNIVFLHNDIVMCDRAFVLYCNDGASFCDILFEDNLVEHNYPDSQRRLIHFKISRRHGEGHIRNVRILNCRSLSAFPKNSEIIGLDEGHLIEDVTIENCGIIGEGIRMSNTKDIKIL